MSSASGLKRRAKLVELFDNCSLSRRAIQHPHNTFSMSTMACSHVWAVPTVLYDCGMCTDPIVSFDTAFLAS